MERRSFIVALLLGVLGIGALSFKRWIRYSDKTNVLAQPKFLSLLCDRNTIRTLGWAYLKLKPEEMKQDVLLNDLLPGRPQFDFLENQDLTTAESEIEKQIKRDFDTDKIVVVQGWVLSITEARQCAYFSTLNA